MHEEKVTVPFVVEGAGVECHTWYKLTRAEDCPADAVPLILVHGGPGSCHEYLSPYEDLCTLAGTPVIAYDQIGGGESTRLPQRAGDRSFWTGELFVEQLAQLVQHLESRGFARYDILGHSWGGMLASRFAARRPRGLRRLILASAPASSARMIEGVKSLLAAMPEAVRTTIERCDAAGDYDDPEYDAACTEFASRHFFPWLDAERKPDDMKRSSAHKGETSVYMDTWGPSEVGVVGTLKDWDTSDECREIEVPTLVFRGELDEVTDHAVGPFVQGIPDVREHVIPGAMHFAHWEKREECMKLCADFLKGEGSA